MTVRCNCYSEDRRQKINACHSIKSIEKDSNSDGVATQSLIMDLQRHLTAMLILFQIYSQDANGKGCLNPRDNLILVSADKAQLSG